LVLWRSEGRREGLCPFNGDERVHGAPCPCVDGKEGGRQGLAERGDSATCASRVEGFGARRASVLRGNHQGKERSRLFYLFDGNPTNKKGRVRAERSGAASFRA
jgi:hypothetical protein